MYLCLATLVFSTAIISQAQPKKKQSNTIAETSGLLYRTCLQFLHQAILRNIKRIAQILILVSLVTNRPSQFFHSTRH